VFGSTKLETNNNNTIKTQRQQSTTSMADDEPEPGPVPGSISHGTPYYVGDRVVIWRGRYTGESGDVIDVFDRKLTVQLDGDVRLNVSVWKNACCLIVDLDNDEDYIDNTDESVHPLVSDSDDDDIYF
jgi:hypothetical protein